MAHKRFFNLAFAFPALALIIALALAACSNPAGSDLKTEPLTEKYTGTQGTKAYELTITQSAANAQAKAVAKSAVRAAFTPAAGDSYVLKITENSVTQISSGTVKAYSNNKFTLASSVNVTVSFEVTITGDSGITSITGTITVQGGDTVAGPGALTPGAGGSGGGGGGSGGGSKGGSGGGGGGGGGFVAVTGISGVPDDISVGTYIILSGTVTPSNATNKTIEWSVKSTAPAGIAFIIGNNLYAAGAGTVIVTATIANGKAASTPYTQDFTITITESGGNGGSGPTFTSTSVAEFETWLNNQADNNRYDPYNVTLVIDDLNDLNYLGTVLQNAPDKYVSIDFSGSTFTSIGAQAFLDCTNFTGVTIPNKRKMTHFTQLQS